VSAVLYVKVIVLANSFIVIFVINCDLRTVYNKIVKCIKVVFVVTNFRDGNYPTGRKV